MLCSIDLSDRQPKFTTQFSLLLRVDAAMIIKLIQHFNLGNQQYNNDMNIAKLSRNRLKMSLSIIEKDTGVQQTVKVILKHVLEFLQENSLHLELLQSEISHKVNSDQFTLALSHKLSALEFLQHFSKVEKFMENIERNRMKEQEKLGKVILEHSNSISNTKQTIQTIRTELSNVKKLDISQHLADINELKKTIEILKIQGMGGNHSQSDSKTSEMLQQLKRLQEFCIQMKHHISDLSKDLKIKTSIENNPKQLQFVTFDELRGVLAQLEANLNTSLSTFLLDCGAKLRNFQTSSNSHLEHSFSFHTKTQHQNYLGIHQQSRQQIYALGDRAMSRSIQQLLISSPQILKLKWFSSYEKNRKSTMAEQINNESKSYRVNFQQHEQESIQANQNTQMKQNYGYSRHRKIYLVFTNSVKVKEPGYYQIMCGFYPTMAAELKIISNGQNIACHAFSEMGKKMVCRTIMIYVKVEQDGCQFCLQCQPTLQQGRTEWTVLKRQRALTGQINGFLYVCKLA